MQSSYEIKKRPPRRYLGWAVVILLIVAGYIQYYKSTRSHLPPGILVAEDPEILQVNYSKSWMLNGYQITPVASYMVRARVLKTKRYYWDQQSNVSPIDVVVGWGQMSDSNELDHLKIYESGRVYTWKANGPLTVTEAYINFHTANLHLIPGSAAIKSIIKSLHPNMIITMSGYIVQVSNDDGFSWNSNIRHYGQNYSKILWVDTITILQH